MKRSKHSLSHYKLVTCNMGELVPVGLIEALPGDTFQQSTSLLLRLSPLMAPVMHPVSVRLHHWFVPNRLLWPAWEDFITGGPDGTGTTEPYPVNLTPMQVTVGSVGDYLGLPPHTAAHRAGTLNMLPFSGYNRIYNEWYRDQDLIPKASYDNTVCHKVAWEKDYFTTARPWSQKGPAVTLPIGSSAPLTITGRPMWKGQNSIAISGLSTNPTDASVAGWSPAVLQTGENMLWHDPGLEADLTNATPADIIDIRRAFALQRYQEARAQYGSRYTEYLRYLGIRSSDARLQRPEYLGGGKQTIAFSEVLRTGNDEATTAPIGEMKGHGIAALRSNRYRYFCEEHGYIFTMLSIRPRSMYVDGIARTWSKRTKEDYYQKELELIGQQEIFNREVFHDGTVAEDGVFGYNDRYAEYRHEYSNVSGEFRTTELDFWHLARKFQSAPVLNKSFIECDPSKRIFAEQTNHSCWIMVSHSIQARRLVGHQTIGRVI